MTARVMIALVLLVLQGSAHMLGQTVSFWLVSLCGLYLAATVAVRWLAQPKSPGQTFDPQWVTTIAVDVIAFSALHILQGGNISYTPLFALPVLLAAVLGSLLLAMGTAAAVTLLLLADAWWMSLHSATETASRFLQAGLTGSGLFLVAFLTHQLALRLYREEEVARRNAREARVQTLVNELVIEHLTDGVLVIDHDNIVRAANPAALLLVSREQPARPAPFVLESEPGWRPLARLARTTFVQGSTENMDIDLYHAGQARCSLQVRTQLAAMRTDESESLCVMFLQDRREMEARVRTEKLAAMGRMSAAVAHEIRNPLAAISQANALLDEELTDPVQKRLTLMVQQNAQRLAHIVDEILDIARVEHLPTDPSSHRIALDEAIQSMSSDWLKQAGNQMALTLRLASGQSPARFAPDHLRRVLVNLLDNARRYARHAAPVQISTGTRPKGQLVLKIWSDGAALEQAVQRHLFEPFFSSESRSSGLGLYICRELCERHGALIAHERVALDIDGKTMEGNEFSVIFNVAGIAQTTAPASLLLPPL
jgi:two-component system sensor histidine kinase PilS (NtrC family)